MKNMMAVTAVLFVLVVAGAGGWMWEHKGIGIDQESQDFVDSTVPKIVGDWDFAEFLKYSDHVAMNKESGTTDAQVSEFFDWSKKKLGSMKEYDGATGVANTVYIENQAQTLAHYQAKATFEKGDATIMVRLARQDGVWKIIGFHVDSPAYNQGQ